MPRAGATRTGFASVDRPRSENSSSAWEPALTRGFHGSDPSDYSASHQPADWQKLVMLVGFGMKPCIFSLITSISTLA